MALVRWEPVRELTSFQSEMNRLFNTFFDTPTTANGSAARRWTPAMDLVETDEHFVLKADLPGLTEDDVNIEVEENVLTISGERKQENVQEGERFFAVERGYGSFSRSFSLPDGTDAEHVSAEVRDGVLTLRVPKKPEVQARRINIGSATSAGSAKA